MPEFEPGGGDSNGGSSTSDSSTSSNTVATGQAKAEKQAMANLRASYREILRAWGLPVSKNLVNLIEKALRGMWSTTQFVDQLRHTPDYKDAYPGIRWKLGQSEAAYLSAYTQFRDRVRDIGEGLTREEFAVLQKKGVEFEEFSLRVDALNAIDTYGPLWDQFRLELETEGIAVPGGTLGKGELTEFLMGLGSKEWERIYQRAYLTTQLEQVAGINVIQGTETAGADFYEVTRADLLKIIKQVEALSPGGELESLTGADFSALGQKLREFKPDYLQRYGITAGDIVNMELGGEGAAEIAVKAQRVLAEQEAFFEPRALPTAEGLGKTSKQELPQSL